MEYLYLLIERPRRRRRAAVCRSGDTDAKSCRKLGLGSITQLWLTLNTPPHPPTPPSPSTARPAQSDGVIRPRWKDIAGGRRLMMALRSTIPSRNNHRHRALQASRSSSNNPTATAMARFLSISRV